MKLNVTFFFLLISLFSFSQVKIPEGFSELTESPANGQIIEKVLINFDNDVIKDEALLVENDSEISNYKLLIYVTSLKKQYEIDLISANDSNIYPIPLKTSKNSIVFGYFEYGTASFGRFITLRYNTKKENVQIIGYDCKYKSSLTCHIDKSYNLLTGKYIVKKTTYNEAGKIKTQEYSGQTDYFINKVFLENLNLEIIILLDDIGSKYE